MFVCRKTFGWHKVSDCLSLTRIEKGTGISRPTISKSLKHLESIGLLKKTQHQNELGDQDPNTYELVVNENPEEIPKEEDDDEGVVKNFNHPVKPVNQGVVKDFNHGVVKNFNYTKENIYTKKNNNKEGVVFYECLSKFESLSDDEKRSLQKFPEERVKLALDFAKIESPKTSLIQLLIWHCKQATPPLASEAKQIEALCKKLEKDYVSDSVRVEAYDSEAAFIYKGHPNPTRIAYKEPDAKEKIMEIYRKNRFKRINPSNSDGSDPNFNQNELRNG
jgi:Fe2+ or Zn2+ uptake regulation protein